MSEERTLFVVRMCGKPVAGSPMYPCTEPFGHGPLPNRVEHAHNGAYAPAHPQEQALDVERLFTALANVTGMRWDAKKIAAEYARLASLPTEGGER